ncbi:hypothetical protein AAFC00_003251 [Neodothiora populina]|uniref:Uncharacterized protein n=1 Tax=Neodothiora populina TaxID=2781224 RepID=A0ABR3PA27_9PEZI
MGAVQSDLKSNIVQASAGNTVIPPSSEEFWHTFWERPETAEHVFETITPSDIRNMRDNPQTFVNLDTLISETCRHLIHLRWTSNSLSDKDAGAGKEVLNCIRILTRVLPFIYESDALREWERSTFWSEKAPTHLDGDRERPNRPVHGESPTSENVADSTPTSLHTGTATCLGVELIDSLLDLAFWSGFTLPANLDGQNGPTYGFWQSGIAYERRLDTSKEFESRRTEILQLLLTLESKSIYMTTGEYSLGGGEAVLCISNHPDRKKVQYLLCSLLNTVMKFQPDARYIRYGESPKEVHETHVRTCLHFLLVNLLNRAPWSDPEGHPPQNKFRDLFSHLHKATHLQFLAEGIAKILRQPLEASSNALHIVQRPLNWAHEILPLLWEAMYCNKYFRAFVCETGRQFELTVFLLFYILDPNSSMEGVVRVSVLCLQVMSESPAYASSLNKPFEGHDNLPTFMQIKNFHGSYADYLLTWLCTILKPDHHGRINAMSASIVGIIVNISPYVVELGRATSLKMMQVLDLVSRDRTLVTTELNTVITSNLVRAINTFVEEHKAGHENENIIWAVWKYGRTFEHLADLRMCSDESFKSFAETIRQEGFTDPLQSPDGSVLIPLVEASHIVEMNKRRLERPDYRSDPWDQLGSPRNSIASLSDFPLEPRSRRGSRQILDAEKVSILSAKAMGKKPQSVSGDNPKDTSMANGDLDIVQALFQQMPLSTTLCLVVSLDAWIDHVLSAIGTEPTRAAMDALTVPEVTKPVRECGSTCLEPSKHLLHKFYIQPPFTAMYAAFYWGLVASQDVERAAVSGSGIWSNTKIKLFRIKAGQVQAPSLFSPKGAVDAVGESLVTGLQNLTLKARQGLTGTNAGASES